MGLLSALITVFKQGLPVADVARTTWVGAKSMFGAILILFFAWTIGNVIGDMATGKFLSTLIQATCHHNCCRFCCS